VIPPKANRKVQREYDKTSTNREIASNDAQHFLRFATRYEKNKENFHALVAIACSWLLQLYVDTA